MNALEAITRARAPLNDTAGVRYTNADGLMYLQEAVRLVRRMRPDAYLDGLREDPAAAIVLTPAPSDVPVGFEHYQAVVDYVSARWQDRDDDLTGEKAASWLAMAVGGVT